MEDRALYPIKYKGKKMFKKDCDEIFIAYYHSVDALGFDKSVHVNKDVGRILPDGEWAKEEDWGY